MEDDHALDDQNEHNNLHAYQPKINHDEIEPKCHEDPPGDSPKDSPIFQRDTQPVLSSPDCVTPYDSSLRMDVLTNGALLSMGEAWQEVMRCEEPGFFAEHPHFQMVMQELWVRGIIDDNSMWIVNPAGVNMFWRRILVEASE